MFDRFIAQMPITAAVLTQSLLTLRTLIDGSLSDERAFAKGQRRVDSAIHASQNTKRSDLAGVLAFLSAIISFAGAMQSGVGLVLILGKGAFAAGAAAKGMGIVGGTLSGGQGLAGGSGKSNPSIEVDRALQAEVENLKKSARSGNAIMAEILKTTSMASFSTLALDLATIKKLMPLIDEPDLQLKAMQCLSESSAHFKAAEALAHYQSALIKAANVAGPEALAPSEKARTLFDHVWGEDRQQTHPHDLELTSVETLVTEIDPKTELELRTTAASELMLTSPKPPEIFEMAGLTTSPPRWVADVGTAIPLTSAEVQLIGDALPKTTKQVRTMRRVHCGDERLEVPSAVWDNPRSRSEALSRIMPKCRRTASERPSIGARP